MIHLQHAQSKEATALSDLCRRFARRTLPLYEMVL